MEDIVFVLIGCCRHALTSDRGWSNVTRVAGTEVVATILQLASLVQKFPYLERKVTRCLCIDQELHYCDSFTIATRVQGL